METYRYLIIGGGMTGDAAVKGIREVDTQGTIGILSAEPHPPYKRPWLSKGLWKDKPFEKVWLNNGKKAAQLHLNTRVQSIDPREKTVVDEAGNRYGYEQLLLAPGGSPRRLPYGGDEIIYYRTMQDYQKLRDFAGPGKRFAVIGGGFIGSESAAALTMQGSQVYMFFPEPAIGAAIYPGDLAQYVTGYYRDKGVEVFAGELVSGVEKEQDQSIVRTQSGKSFTVDAVIAGIGIKPNTELAESAGLRTDDGILVDESLRASTPAIFAAGDVARFYSQDLGQTMRVEHEDNALTMGKAAGRNMALNAGQATLEVYHHLPYFYSDLFELGYEAVGELNARGETVSDWQEPFQKGVIYYLQADQVRGVLLWDVWDQVPAARELIASQEFIRTGDLIGRIR